MIRDSIDGLRSRIPDSYRDATYLWICSRRGRVAIITSVLMLAAISVFSQTSTETLSSYTPFASYYRGWTSTNPAVPQSPLLTLTQTTLELESGNLTEVPENLRKGNPSFHVIFPNPEKNNDFCKATVAGMVLRYPPPTLINGFRSDRSYQEREIATLRGTFDYLMSPRVQDEDLILIVDGNFAWFQFPPDVLIKQYEDLITEANKALLKKYGLDQDGYPLFNQTSIWAAMKTCPTLLHETPACLAVPESPLSNDLYGPSTDEGSNELFRPRYFSSSAAIGPAKDMRAMYERAILIQDKYIDTHEDDNEKDKEVFTAEMALASVFGEQEYTRTLGLSFDGTTSWQDHSAQGPINTTFEANPHKRYDYGIGLDYRSTLFQILSSAAPHEFATRRFDDNPQDPPALPRALVEASSPFISKFDVDGLSPNKKHLPYSTELRFDPDLDSLPDPEANSWSNLSLITNTANPSIPAIIIVPHDGGDENLEATQRSDYWNSLWFHPYARALVRRYFRTSPQGVLSFHNAAVGGDRAWDVRGGEGGVWTSSGLWKEFALDVCEDMEVDIFGDGKGRLIKESDDTKRRNEKARQRQKEKEQEEKEKKEKEQKEKEQKEKEQKEKEQKEKEEKEKEEKGKGENQNENEDEKRKKKRGDIASGPIRIRKRDMYMDRDIKIA